MAHRARPSIYCLAVAASCSQTCSAPSRSGFGRSSEWVYSTALFRRWASCGASSSRSPTRAILRSRRIRRHNRVGAGCRRAGAVAVRNLAVRSRDSHVHFFSARRAICDVLLYSSSRSPALQVAASVVLALSWETEVRNGSHGTENRKSEAIFCQSRARRSGFRKHAATGIRPHRRSAPWLEALTFASTSETLGLLPPQCCLQWTQGPFQASTNETPGTHIRLSAANRLAGLFQLPRSISMGSSARTFCSFDPAFAERVLAGG
jgi:hypothetical protein